MSLEADLAKAEQQRDDAYQAIREAGRIARGLRTEVQGHRETVEGLAEALKIIQERAVQVDGNPADVLHQIGEDAGRALTVAFADAAARGLTDAKP